jgi:hypothetical protein
MATLNKNIKPIYLPRGNTPKPGIITPKTKDTEEEITKKTDDIPISFDGKISKDGLIG